MTLVSNDKLEEMRARRSAGATIRAISDEMGIKTSTIYQQFNRKFGGTPLPGPCNDNNPQRVTLMTARNGGCSTTSGKMPVTLARIPSISKEPVPMSAREQLLAANDDAIMQVSV